jgi:transcription initiation factor IIE alpha subunit
MAHTGGVNALECLEKHGQRLDYEIADETGVSLTKVREQFAALAGSGRVITCKLTRFEKGLPVEAYLYRASGFFPKPAPGRKPK